MYPPSNARMGNGLTLGLDYRRSDIVYHCAVAEHGVMFPSHAD